MGSFMNIRIGKMDKNSVYIFYEERNNNLLNIRKHKSKFLQICEYAILVR